MRDWFFNNFKLIAQMVAGVIIFVAVGLLITGIIEIVHFFQAN